MKLVEIAGVLQTRTIQNIYSTKNIHFVVIGVNMIWKVQYVKIGDDH